MLLVYEWEAGSPGREVAPAARVRGLEEETHTDVEGGDCGGDDDDEDEDEWRAADGH